MAKNQSIRCTRAGNCASQEAVCGAATGISPTSWPRLDVDGRTLARFSGVMPRRVRERKYTTGSGGHAHSPRRRISRNESRRD